MAPRGGSRKSPRGGGLSIKGPANLTYAHFQKHPGFRLLFFKKALFSFLKEAAQFLNFIKKAKRAPTTSLVIVLSQEDLKGPERPERHLGQVRKDLRHPYGSGQETSKGNICMK